MGARGSGSSALSRRTELTAGSIITYSFSDRWIIIGESTSSGEVLCMHGGSGAIGARAQRRVVAEAEQGGSAPPRLNLGLVMPLHNLRGKVLQAERRVQGLLDALEIGLEGRGPALRSGCEAGGESRSGCEAGRREA